VGNAIQQEGKLVADGNTELKQKDQPVQNQNQNADFLDQTQIDVLLRKHGTDLLDANDSNELNWCTSLAFDYFFASLHSRATSGKRTARRISIVNTDNAVGDGFHWFVVAYSIGCDNLHGDVNLPVDLSTDDDDDLNEWEMLHERADRPINDTRYGTNEHKG
jgi:hypothetical protein